MASLLRLKDSEAFVSPRSLQNDHACLELKSVGKSFDGRSILGAVDLVVHPGQFVAIVGRSGSGKSTLLRLLAGLETADSGTITPPPPNTRIMFQDGRLLPWRRVLQNVTLGLAKSEHGRARAALQAVGLADRGREWPRVLSGGQRQRVALARALAAEPSLILLDEPLGALDALTRLEMQDLIERLWLERGFTAILVTHDIAEAVRLADRILLIDSGRIAMDVPVHLPRPRRPSAEGAEIEQMVLGNILKG